MIASFLRSQLLLTACVECLTGWDTGMGRSRTFRGRWQCDPIKHASCNRNGGHGKHYGASRSETFHLPWRPSLLGASHDFHDVYDDDASKRDKTSSKYEKAMQRAMKLEMDAFVQQNVPTWLQPQRQNNRNKPDPNDDHDHPTAVVDVVAAASGGGGGGSGLPFDCTACGKCCRTVGAVYMSPAETRDAAAVLQLPSADHFVRTYASHILRINNNNTNEHVPLWTVDEDLGQYWIRLRDTDLHGQPIVLNEAHQDNANIPFDADERATACIFLDLQTNQCRIYQARPVQCRTYPFWPNIVASVETWNAECRRKDSDDSTTGDYPTLLPLWTPLDGGCEGMLPIVPDPSVKARSTGSLDERSSAEFTSIVPMDQVYQQMHEFHAATRRFPTRAEEIPL